MTETATRLAQLNEYWFAKRETTSSNPVGTRSAMVFNYLVRSYWLGSKIVSQFIRSCRWTVT